MPISRRSNSRFSLTNPIVSSEGNITFGIAEKFTFLDRNNLSNDDIGQIVIDADLAGRPDELARKLYGNPHLMWIPIVFNHVENPFNWPLNNQIVEYPVIRVVFAEI